MLLIRLLTPPIQLFDVASEWLFGASMILANERSEPYTKLDSISNIEPGYFYNAPTYSAYCS